jgi:hypothetical protein
MGLSELHEEEFKRFTTEYNYNDKPPSDDLEYYANALQHHNEAYCPRINGLFLNNLDPTFYAVQMQNPDVLTHTQI